MNRKRLPIPDLNDPMQWIKIEDAYEHNLRHISTQIPRNRFVVVTGISGSGKSSLAIDTLFKEGQRRFVESLSSYARQFLGQMDKPRVKSITGISPAICIEQKTGSVNPRSTVGTVTEIMDHLRVLYASIGIPHCPSCGRVIQPLSPQQVVEKVMEKKEGTRIKIIAPIVMKEKGTFVRLFDELRKEGYNRIEVDGKEYLLDDEEPSLDKNYKHDISAVIDRIRIKQGIAGRINEAVETSFRRAEGRVKIEYIDEGNSEIYYEYAGCPVCGISIGELNPRLFSFNSPFGACETCQGLGYVIEVDPELIIKDRNLSVREGGIAFMSQDSDSWTMKQLEVVLKHYGFDLDTPIKKWSKKCYNAVLYGSDQKINFKIEGKNVGKMWKYEVEKKTEGLVNIIKRRHRQTKSDNSRKYYERFMANLPCPSCNGAKLKKASLGVLVGGKNIIEVTQMSVDELNIFFNNIKLTEREKQISDMVLKEIINRIGFLKDVGLGYLTLDRKASTLSGGESQRIRLATQIGSKLVGVLYVLDEPSIGLHQKDNERLMNTFFELRDIGNTIVVIEHDDETILNADYILDLGPKAGRDGGRIVAYGTPDDIANSEESITGKYLRGEWNIDVPKKRRKPNGHWLKMKNVSHNNLKNINVKIPLGVMTVVTGVSGSGKSSLVNDVLWKHLAREFHNAGERPGKHGGIDGLEYLDKVIMIDQSPIGRTPRSNPATYTKVFDHIRDLFASLPQSKFKGYEKGRFSFNVKGGRCEKCKGHGYIKVDMNFLGQVFIECDVCHTKRYNSETLDIYYKGKNIADVLDMTIDEAADFFRNIPKIYSALKTLQDVGMGYVHLGQPATTLSGGEAQRIKLSKELSKKVTGNTLILLDEPTTGLAKHDVKKLLEILHRLVDKGNSILCIEHNMDVIKNADYIIDLGPEGGDKGGEIVAQGTPEQVAKNKNSYTGYYLGKIIKNEKLKN